MRRETLPRPHDWRTDQQQEIINNRFSRSTLGEAGFTDELLLNPSVADETSCAQSKEDCFGGFALNPRGYFIGEQQPREGEAGQGFVEVNAVDWFSCAACVRSEAPHGGAQCVSYHCSPKPPPKVSEFCCLCALRRRGHSPGVHNEQNEQANEGWSRS